MKRILFLLLAGLSSCVIDDPPNDFNNGTSRTRTVIPVTIPKAELATSVHTSGPQAMVDPGKIYVFNTYLYVVERYKGVHVIDNSNQFAPKNISFITIPGCVDIAVRNNTLYADNAIDLVAIDVSNPTAATVTARHQNVFPQLPLPEDVGTVLGHSPDPFKDVIIAWKDTSIR